MGVQVSLLQDDLHPGVGTIVSITSLAAWRM
jgi:hypothetical protein